MQIPQVTGGAASSHHSQGMQPLLKKQEECAICLAQKATCQFSGCSHKACQYCTERWAAQKCTCPICRAPFSSYTLEQRGQSPVHIEVEEQEPPESTQLRLMRVIRSTDLLQVLRQEAARKFARACTRIKCSQPFQPGKVSKPSDLPKAEPRQDCAGRPFLAQIMDSAPHRIGGQVRPRESDGQRVAGGLHDAPHDQRRVVPRTAAVTYPSSVTGICDLGPMIVQPPPASLPRGTELYPVMDATLAETLRNPTPPPHPREDWARKMMRATQNTQALTGDLPRPSLPKPQAAKPATSAETKLATSGVALARMRETGCGYATKPNSWCSDLAA